MAPLSMLTIARPKRAGVSEHLFVIVVWGVVVFGAGWR